MRKVSPLPVALTNNASTIWNYTNPLAPVPRGFDPRPELRRDNTTLTIIIVGLNAVTYENKVNDPLFNATVPMEVKGLDSKGGRPIRTLYYASKFARALACQEQVSEMKLSPCGFALTTYSINFATNFLPGRTSAPN